MPSETAEDTEAIIRFLDQQRGPRRIYDIDDVHAVGTLECMSYMEHDFSESFDFVRRQLTKVNPHIKRIAVVLYDSDLDLVKAYAESSEDGSPTQFTSSRLADHPFLKQVYGLKQIRIIHDLEGLPNATGSFTRRLIDLGYRSSMTMPLLKDGELFGFLFVNASAPRVFNDDIIEQCEPYLHMLRLTVITQFLLIHTLNGAVRSARDVSQYRDEETAAHLARMSRYSRSLANALREKQGFSQEFVEFLFRFAPLHDFGKVGIPDRILLKPGRLTDDEIQEMRKHPEIGHQLMERMLANLRLEKMPFAPMLQNIILYHHERWDGKGYPNGLKGEEIPIEARIVSVADVFDALTSPRPYKDAWRVETAVGFLKQESGNLFDPACVEAFLSIIDEVKEIKRRFVDDVPSE